MAINIHSLIKSEKELSDSFCLLFAYCLKMHNRLLEYIKNKKINEEGLEKFLYYKNKVVEIKNNIRNDCIWIISKDQPRATHLRFIIAIMYSIKDLERISEYAYNIFYYMYKTNLPELYIKEINFILEKSNITFTNLINMFDKNNVNSLEEKYLQEISLFKEDYKKFLKINLLKIKSNIDKNIDDFYHFSIMIKYVERTIDHIESIFSNFMIIKSF